MDAVENRTYDSMLINVGVLQGQQAAMISQIQQMNAEIIRLGAQVDFKHRENQTALDTARQDIDDRIKSQIGENNQRLEKIDIRMKADMEENNRRFEKVHRIIWMGGGVLLTIQGYLTWHAQFFK